MAPVTYSLKQAVSIGVRAASDTKVPGIILLVFATSMAVSYYHIPWFKGLCDQLGSLKQQYGYLFSFCFQSIMCGLMPWLIRMMLPGLKPRYPLAELIFGMSLWGIEGIMMDTLYMTQAAIFGSDPSPLIVLAKTLCDMLIYTPFIAVPLNSLTHYWKDGGFTRKRWQEATARGWYVRIALPNYISSLALWCPGVIIIYSLPPSLQLPMASTIGCFFALLCSFIASHSVEHPVEE